MRGIANKTAALLAYAALVLTEAGAFAATSATVLVDSDLRHARWATVFTNAVDLKWEWPADAAYATLDITGMNGSITTNLAPPVSRWIWRVFETALPSAEDVYDLTLTFHGGSDGTVGALTSRLAVVAGAFGETPVNADTGSPAWTRIKENVVIPYDAGWTNTMVSAVGSQLVIAKEGGAAQTNLLTETAGYIGWKLKGGDWGYGTFGLSLTFPGTEGEWAAALTRIPGGTMIKFW